MAFLFDAKKRDFSVFMQKECSAAVYFSGIKYCIKLDKQKNK